MRISRDNKVYSFARGMTPAATVNAGDVVVFETNDCYDGQVSLEGDELKEADVDRSRVNPATGLVFITGAQPGDMIVAHIEKVEVAPRGLIFGSNREGDIREGRPVDIVDGKAELPGGFRFPVDTVVGVIGVAPAAEPISNSTPGDHGGNLDTPDVKAGCTVYLPVAEEGGMFGVGDLHALQGDGEVCGQGIEIAGEVTVRLQVMKGSMGVGPIILTPQHWAVVASAKDLDEAVDLALMRARDFLMSRIDVKDHEAIMLLSALADVRISQIVNPLRTVRVCIPRKLVGA